MTQPSQPGFEVSGTRLENLHWAARRIGLMIDELV
ncbi:MAG: hypothetical protein JWQ49_4545 [Edaphobacter sp.]|nr:hypothetical protein [Edaphobacter sp.]